MLLQIFWYYVVTSVTWHNTDGSHRDKAEPLEKLKSQKYSILFFLPPIYYKIIFYFGDKKLHWAFCDFFSSDFLLVPGVSIAARQHIFCYSSTSIYESYNRKWSAPRLPDYGVGFRLPYSPHSRFQSLRSLGKRHSDHPKYIRTVARLQILCLQQICLEAIPSWKVGPLRK